MQFRKALPLFQAGSPIRRASWPADVYVSLGELTPDATVAVKDVLASNWEIYEPVEETAPLASGPETDLGTLAGEVVPTVTAEPPPPAPKKKAKTKKKGKSA